MEENKQIKFTLVNKCISLWGKSEMLHYIVTAEQNKFHKIFCISPRNVTNDFYNNFIPKENIFNEWSKEWVNDLIEILKNLNKNKKSQLDSPANILLILDDCCSNSKFHQSRTFQKIFTICRHYFLSCIITSQYITPILILF